MHRGEINWWAIRVAIPVFTAFNSIVAANGIFRMASTCIDPVMTQVTLSSGAVVLPRPAADSANNAIAVEASPQTGV